VVFLHAQTKSDVFKNSQVRKYRIVLKHHGQTTIPGGQIVDAILAHMNMTAIRSLQTGHDAQQSGFSTAGCAQQNQKLLVGDLQINAFESAKLTKRFFDMLYLNLSHCVHRLEMPHIANMCLRIRNMKTAAGKTNKAPPTNFKCNGA